jgi:N-acetylmuramoyl-L-alanine amidase
MTVVRVILVAWLLATAAAHAQFAGRKFVIDPGHGGVDPGAVGIDGGAYPNEEDFVLDVAQRLKTRLEGAGAEVILTRSTDATVSLTARRDLANAEDPDAFLSIHCNSFTNATANGTETFWWESGNTADQTLATHVQNRMMDAFDLTNRGVKQGNFTVITGIPPSSLAEMMFISNQAEFDLMNTPATRQAAAEAFYRAFGDFLGIDTSAPVITDQPDTVTVNPGQTAAFTVAATGTGLTYRWRRNGVNLSNGGAISGATTPTLTVTGAQLANTGFYTAAVTSGSSTSISDEAQLVIAATPTAAGNGSGLRATYYDNPDFTALRRVRLDATVNFNWAAGSPSSTMDVDTFSVRWTGQLAPRYSQTYSFHVRSDDGVRLWVNNVLLIDKWVAQSATEWSGTLAMVAGQKYDIRLEYFDGAGNALAELRWSSPSQVKQIIPTTQLFRPPPVIVAVPPTTVLQGEALNLAITTSSFDPLLSSQPWADFEDETDGATDLVLFRKPEFSGTTSAHVDLTKTRGTTVRAAFPAGNSSTRALHVEWSWAAGAANPWIRLTTFLASTLPNPVIDFRKTLRFDVWSEHTLRFGLGLRETNSTGAIGSDGGSAGAIEFVGVNAMNGTSPVPVRTLAPDSWTTLEFDLPTEPARAFTGNGLLESTTGLGVLEHLSMVAGSASIDHDVYLDNFVVVEKNQLTYSLLAGPNGATIDPNTGAISWTPTAAQVGINHPFTVQVSDGGSPAVNTTVSFSIPAAPYPEIVATTRSGPDFTFTWKAAPGAKYDIETAIHPAGPWTVVTEITAATAIGSYSAVIAGTQKFYRARLK